MYVGAISQLISFYSDGGTEGSSRLEEVVEVTLLGTGGHLEVVSRALASLDIKPDGLGVVDRHSLTLLVVQLSTSIGDSFIVSLLGLSNATLMFVGVHNSEHLVIRVIDIKLHGVLVVSEQSVVTIGQISESAALLKTKLISDARKARFNGILTR